MNDTLFYVRVAEALGRPAKPDILSNAELLRSVMERNRIPSPAFLSRGVWEARTTVDAFTGEISALGPVPETAVWNLVLELKAAGKLVLP